MTGEMGNSGTSGYGYTSHEDLGQRAEPYHGETHQKSEASPAPSGASEDVQATNTTSSSEPLSDSRGSQVVSGEEAASEAQPIAETEVSEQITPDRCDEVPGYKSSASICINRAREIARSLNHTSISADHLMLALTLDQNARRLLERVGDVTQLREAAMQKLGRYGSAKSDLAEIARAAREAANEREQSVGTVIAEGLKIVGSVTAEGLVEVNGQIEGELHCTSLIVSRKAQVVGTVTAERVVVDGRVEGPIQGGEVLLKSQAHVVGDIHHQSLAIEKGAYFEGRAAQTHGADGRQPDRVGKRVPREAASNSRKENVAAE